MKDMKALSINEVSAIWSVSMLIVLGLNKIIKIVKYVSK